MTTTTDTKNGKRAGSDDPEILLGLLSAIEQDSRVTQRSLSKDLGIALGLANAYLKRCVTKGLVKVRQVPLNRYTYYLTPQGFTEKSRLTAEYLTISFNFFRDARTQCAKLLDSAVRQGWRRIVLVGAGELAEIAVLSAAEYPVEIIAIVDDAATRSRCAGVAVVADVATVLRSDRKAAGIDGFFITNTQAPQAAYEQAVGELAAAGYGADRILVPPMLHISTASDAVVMEGEG